MKKILVLAFFSSMMHIKAQIVFEHKYDTASTDSNLGVGRPNQLMIVHFELSGERYVKINRESKLISIYDLNHALLKSFSYSGFPQSANNVPT